MKLSFSQLLNMVLVAVLATSVFFMNTKSTIETKTAQAVTYDPWLDYNEDGYIGIDDIFSTANNFGAEGDPTKNVTVANWPSNKLAYSIETSVSGFAGFESPYISVAGYSRISICIWNDAADDQYWLYARHMGGWVFTADYAENMPNNLVKTYDAPNEEIRVRFFNVDAGSRNLKLDVYLIP